ncbi:MAG: transposase [Elusimicrobia bacterium]|nr:transposase [Elusimicrobiota bacterium]MDE2237846.1 transposase [Elusimicrobiota bacterium]MDE2424937.1 transposase [Elusimicrobiota bacterium]
MPIFRDEADCEFFLRRMSALRKELGIRILAYCLMGNHYHLLLQSGKMPLSVFMQRLLTAYVIFFNGHWQTCGHPFQGRFGSRRCQNENDVRGVIRYVHANPVDSGLARDPADWIWSGHREILGSASSQGLVDIPWVLELFGGGEEGRLAYAGLMAQPEPSIKRRPLAEILADEARGAEAIVRGRDRSERALRLRRAFIVEALQAGHRRSAIAAYLGRGPSAITYLLAEG